MKNKLILGLLGILFLSTIIFSSCEEPEPVPVPVPEKTYLVRTGAQASGGGSFEKGVFVSPNGALVPYLVEDGRSVKTLSQVESFLRSLNFDQNWIQSVKNNLNTNKSAFVFYTNASSYYRWIWITEN